MQVTGTRFRGQNSRTDIKERVDGNDTIAICNDEHDIMVVLLESYAVYLYEGYSPDSATSPIWRANTCIAFAACITAFIYLLHFLMTRYILSSEERKPLRFLNTVRLIYAGVTFGNTLPACLYPYILNAGVSCEVRGGIITFLKIVEMCGFDCYIAPTLKLLMELMHPKLFICYGHLCGRSGRLTFPDSTYIVRWRAVCVANQGTFSGCNLI
ncbi:hypothetical protein BC832DRAFT_462871 [Gaertneriomyces semiglobifer]|nr:hypothetical protein BC832DRAFT_462871 [Gaertneriomyces semiglobifer]